MKNFNGGGFKKGGDFGGGKRYGGGQNSNREHSGHGKFGGAKRNDFHGEGHNRRERSFDAPQLFAAVCSDCGKGCEVPFRPSAEKPVYCSACFGKKKHDGERDSRDGARVPEFKKETAKVHFEKPVRFDSDEKYGALTKQLVTLESKVNMILEIMSTHKSHTKEVAPEKTAEGTKAKAVKKEVKPKVAIAKVAAKAAVKVAPKTKVVKKEVKKAKSKK
jgi:CxxC-x17-CxxC domain-containing protein